MKCRCPACGRSTEIEPELLDFLARCQRCGVLLKTRSAELHGEDAERDRAVVAKVVPITRGGYVREEGTGDGRIADLLSRPPARGRPKSAETSEPKEMPEVALAGNPAAAVVAEGMATTRRRKLSATEWRRTQLQEQHRTLGIVGIFGLALCALMALGALALKSRHMFLRTARAGVDVVETRALPR